MLAVEHKPPFKLGLLFGLGVILALALLDMGLVVLVFTAPITLLTVVRVLLVLLTLPVAGMALYGLTEQTLTRPQTLRGGFFSDRTARVTLALGGILNLALYLLVAANFNRLPHTLPLHFGPAGTPDRVGAPAELFTLVALGTAAWVVDGVLGYVIYRRLEERMAAYLLWGAAAGLQILLWVAIAGLVRV